MVIQVTQKYLGLVPYRGDCLALDFCVVAVAHDSRTRELSREEVLEPALAITSSPCPFPVPV